MGPASVAFSNAMVKMSRLQAAQARPRPGRPPAGRAAGVCPLTGDDGCLLQAAADTAILCFLASLGDARTVVRSTGYAPWAAPRSPVRASAWMRTNCCWWARERPWWGAGVRGERDVWVLCAARGQALPPGALARAAAGGARGRGQAAGAPVLAGSRPAQSRVLGFALRARADCAERRVRGTRASGPPGRARAAARRRSLRLQGPG